MSEGAAAMANGSADFRGVGWAFPVQADDQGHISLARQDEAIRQSIRLIIETAKGERIMRPTFGCGIHDLVFAPNDPLTAARASFEVREALIDWEPRIEVLDVQTRLDTAEENTLLIDVQYRVRSTNNVFNLVYPFYLRLGGG
jgi:phage baseplate assembly protein W